MQHYKEQKFIWVAFVKVPYVAIHYITLHWQNSIPPEKLAPFNSFGPNELVVVTFFR